MRIGSTRAAALRLSARAEGPPENAEEYSSSQPVSTGTIVSPAQRMPAGEERIYSQCRSGPAPWQAKLREPMTRIESSAKPAWNRLPASLAVADDEPLTRRDEPEPPHAYRSPFVRDCGRILHARAFRRLAGKTQVFTRSQTESDHSRSRLTHTLEVAQIARTMASALGLNAHLAEALALVHDIGHPPFGHAGERALDAALRPHGLRFDHNLHALRIVTIFEQRHAGFTGLNLTLGVREGILKHSRDYRSAEHPELAAYFLDQLPPVEAQLIDLADEIAYLTADLEDGFESGILRLDQARAELPLLDRTLREAEREHPAAAERLLRNDALKSILNALVTDLLAEVARRAAPFRSLAQVSGAGARVAAFSEAVEADRQSMRRFLYRELYESAELEAEHRRAAEIVSTLFDEWVRDPSLLPADHAARAEREGAVRTVTDYIAGMTDSYIEQAWNRFRQAR